MMASSQKELLPLLSMTTAMMQAELINHDVDSCNDDADIPLLPT
jgi:hypothetical protein